VREAALRLEAASVAQLASGADDADSDVGQRCHVELVGEWRAQADDLLDRVRHSRREHLREHATTAVADQAYASIGLGADSSEPLAQPRDHVLGLLDVERDP